MARMKTEMDLLRQQKISQDVEHQREIAAIDRENQTLLEENKSMQKVYNGLFPEIREFF